MMTTDNDIASLAQSVTVVMQAMVKTNDRRHASMMMLACISSLIGNDETDRLIMADALMQTACELDAHIKLRVTQ